MKARALLTAVVCAAVLTVPASAGAVWFGAVNMNAPANLGFDCTGYPTQMGLYPTGTTSCTVFTTARFGETNLLRSNIVPKGRGYIVAFRIRTGVRSGPMQLTILTQLRDLTNAGETACCIGKTQGQVVWPPANAVTTIPLAQPIPVFNGLLSRTQESFDTIAISLRDQRAVIPASYDPSTYTLGSAFYPMVAPGQERFGGASLPTGPLTLAYFQVLLQAQWEPAAGVQAKASSVRVLGGATLVPLSCRFGQPCVGALRLQNVRGAAAQAAAAPATYGSATVNIGAGATKSVKVTLTRAGKALMRKYRTRKVWANATLKLGGGNVVIAMPLTLTR